MKHGKTAVYTILKNERKNIDRWIHYAKPFDYYVLLDTGSTDGSWEYLYDRAKYDPKLIVDRKDYGDEFRFDVARIHNLRMIPTDVTWCLSPDLDEYYSLNTHDEMERIIDGVPNITCIACDRLDIYSRTVRVGPPNFLPTNKIHRREDYSWKERVYEHIYWTTPFAQEVELYSEDIFLVHDQDFNKSERSPLYIRLMEEEWQVNPTNVWNNWFLLYYYYQSKQLDKYIPVACNFATYHTNYQDQNYKSVVEDLKMLYTHANYIDADQRYCIGVALGYE